MTKIKRVLVACSSRKARSTFSNHGGEDAAMRALQRHGVSSSSAAVHFVFVNPQGPDLPGHVRASLLSFLHRANAKFDAILLMGCNSVTWLLELDTPLGYSPWLARAILHDALAPGGVLMVFENETVGGQKTVTLQNLHQITATRFEHGSFLDEPDAFDMIDELFAATHWTRLGPGVYKRRSLSPGVPRVDVRASNRNHVPRRKQAIDRVATAAALEAYRRRRR